MTDVTVKGGLTQENAILLLAAVAELELDPSQVRTTLKGFVTDKKIAKKAGVDWFDPDAEFNAEIAEAEQAAEDDVVQESEPQPGADEDGFGGDAPEPAQPKVTDSKAAWADYAKTQGETDESLTKKVLIEKYGNKE